MRLLLIVLVVWCTAQNLAAQPADSNAPQPAAEDPRHNELRAFRADVVSAVNEQDLDRLLSYLTDDVIVTWQNAEISRSPAEVREYYNRMMHGERPIVQSVTVDPVPDQLTKIVGDIGIAHGTSDDRFVLTDGRDFTIGSVWSATVVRQDDGWKIASFHASADIFDNPVMWIAVRQAGMWAAIAGAVLGIVLGVLIAWILKRGSKGVDAAA